MNTDPDPMDAPFASAAYREQVRRLTCLAKSALQAYPLSGTRLRLLSHLWNTTFRVVSPDGDRYMLRVHHPGQTSVPAVRSELLWLAALRNEARLPVPDPVRNREQELVTVAAHPGVPQPRLCVLFRWVEGRFIFRGLTPSHLFRVGSLLGRLQQHAISWPLPAAFTRHRVDNLDPMVRWRNDDYDPAVAAAVVQTVSDVSSREATAIVEVAIRTVWSAMRERGEGPDQFGLIHGDLHHRNFLFHRGVAGAIDFDDCGFGHWLYDLAVTLSALKRCPDYPILRPAFLAGYRQNRPLSSEQEENLDTFLALRRIQDLLGVIDEREHPAFRDTWQGHVAAHLQGLMEYLGGVRAAGSFRSPHS